MRFRGVLETAGEEGGDAGRMRWGGCVDGLCPRGARLAAVISAEEQLRSLLHPGAQGELINNLGVEKNRNRN